MIVEEEVWPMETKKAKPAVLVSVSDEQFDKLSPVSDATIKRTLEAASKALAAVAKETPAPSVVARVRVR